MNVLSVPARTNIWPPCSRHSPTISNGWEAIACDRSAAATGGAVSSCAAESGAGSVFAVAFGSIDAQLCAGKMSMISLPSSVAEAHAPEKQAPQANAKAQNLRIRPLMIPLRGS
ncbi:hypothetical protein [Achromobacter xylosoxidans]|uniref:hypothetical protein n=1 Tax=Alcaligenes xylosoxydans xylosoxydans TaxID=85698 RepID=UPI001F142E10|nr:hypothetical protein [Achromobacter xylosoxidans]